MQYACRKHGSLDSSEYDTSLFEIQGYNLISAGKYCSPHRGLIIYLREDYNFEIFNLHPQSMIWDGLFIEINGKALGRKHAIVGNKTPKRCSTKLLNIYF